MTSLRDSSENWTICLQKNLSQDNEGYTDVKNRLEMNHSGFSGHTLAPEKRSDLSSWISESRRFHQNPDGFPRGLEATESEATNWKGFCSLFVCLFFFCIYFWWSIYCIVVMKNKSSPSFLFLPAFFSTMFTVFHNVLTVGILILHLQQIIYGFQH